MYYKIPLSTDAYLNFTQTIQNKIYHITYIWNTEGQFGTLSFYDSFGNTIVKGLKLVLNTNLLENYQYNPDLFAGGLYLIRKDRTATPPKQWEMDTEVELIYQEFTEDDY